MTPEEIVRVRDFGLAANFAALKLQLSRFVIDREGAVVAYEVAYAHLQLTRAITAGCPALA